MICDILKMLYFPIFVIAFLFIFISINSTNAQMSPDVSVNINSTTPFPTDLRNITSHFCNTMLGSNEVDPQILQFVIENNPNAIKNSNQQFEKSIVVKQFWNILEQKIIISDPKFHSIGGVDNSIIFSSQNEVSNLMCPGTWGLNGTFESNNEKTYNFKFTASDYNYRFVPTVKTLDTIPEFPLAIPILAVSITSLIIFYNTKIGKLHS